jgi:hypothetical protein
MTASERLLEPPRGSRRQVSTVEAYFRDPNGAAVDEAAMVDACLDLCVWGAIRSWSSG